MPRTFISRPHRTSEFEMPRIINTGITSRKKPTFSSREVQTGSKLTPVNL
jgi:hypothetical protein